MSAHNVFVVALVEIGIISFAFFVALISIILWKLYSLIKKTNNKYLTIEIPSKTNTLAIFTEGVFVSTLAILVYCIFHGELLTWQLYTTLGISSSAIYINKFAHSKKLTSTNEKHF